MNGNLPDINLVADTENTIVCTVVYLIVGIAMFYLWPFVQLGISKLGGLVLNSGYAGTWIYGILERALIPFGLHHVFYMPFWCPAKFRKA